MSDFDEAKAIWEERFDRTELANVWINIVIHTFLLIVSVTVLVRVPYYYKRRECFLLAIPAVFMA